MGLGDDIASVFEEVGSKVEVYKHGTGDTYTEYIDSEKNITERSPYLSQAYLQGVFAYNSNADSGDLISFVDDPDNIDYFLLIASVKERFAGELITKDGVLLRCNTEVQIKRKTESRDNYDLSVDWPIIHSGEYAHFTGDLQSMELNEQDFGWTIIDRNLLYLSGDLDVKNEDRCIIVSGMGAEHDKAYEIELVEDHHLPNIKICRLAEDTRR